MNHLVVVDVEATCWTTDTHPALAANQVNECEIIEIGAVRFPLESQQRFRCLIRPRRHPVLSPFCTTLTGLMQADVDSGQPFSEAYKAFADWVGDAVVGSWGAFDHAQFIRDCRWANVSPPTWEHVNLKRWWARFAKRGQRRVDEPS